MAILDLIGNPLTTWKETPESPRISADAAGVEVVRIYRVASGSLATNLPSLGTADAVYTTAKLSMYRTSGKSAYPEVECVYRTNSANQLSGVVNPVGTVVRRADASPERVPIEQHPNFVRKVTNETTGAVVATLTFGGVAVDYPGLEAYTDPRPIYSYTKTYLASSVDFDEATIIGKVGWLIVPPEMDGSPTEMKWLQIGRTIEEKGDVVDIGESFQYHPAGYSGKVYKVNSLGDYVST